LVLKIMDTLLKLVKMHVTNINISHYKMVMDRLVGVVVIMNYLMLLNTVLLHVELQEVHGVITYIKTMIINH